MKLHLPTINQFASLLVLNITNAAFQLLLIPILIHHTNNENLGAYFIALSYSVLVSILINFGTSQTAVVEIRKATTEQAQQKILAETIAVRTLPLVIAMLVTCIFSLITNNGLYFFLLIPILLAEYINPQFYLIAKYKINKYTFYNLLLRIVLIAVVYFTRKNTSLIEITIIGTGLTVLLLNLIYLPSTFLKTGTLKSIPSVQHLKTIIRTNSLVVGNGLTVHLQQSMFLFALPTFTTPLFVSAYGFMDKLISSFRLIVNAYTSALMPQAASAHELGFNHWKNLKQQQNKILAVCCIMAGAIMYIFPSQLLTILLLGKNNEAAIFKEATSLMRMTSAVPFLIALNVLNVAELILEKKFMAYFIAGVFIMATSFLCLSLFSWGLPAQYAGYYPMVIEGVCLIVYMVIVKKLRNANQS